MSDDQQQAGPGVAQQQFQLNSQLAAAQSGGGGGDSPGTLIDTLLRMFGIKTGLNGHSTGGLDTILNLGSIFGGLSLQGKSLFGSQLDMRGGILTSFFAELGFTFGGNIHGGSAADTGSAPSAAGGEAPANMADAGGAASGGGDAQYASLNTIPTAAIHETGIQNLQAEVVQQAAPAPKATARAAKRSSEGESMSR